MRKCGCLCSSRCGACFGRQNLCKKEVAEGPFVDITGTYDIARKQPVVEVVERYAP
jgi:UbiD family decarboxylase